MEEDKARDFYVKLQVLRQHMQKMQEHIEDIDEKTVELQKMIDTVKEAATIQENDDMLVPLTNGIYMPAKALGSQKMYLNVGAKIIIAKTPEETEKILSKQFEELTKYRANIVEQQQDIQDQAQAIEEQVAQAMQDNV